MRPSLQSPTPRLPLAIGLLLPLALAALLTACASDVRDDALLGGAPPADDVADAGADHGGFLSDGGDGTTGPADVQPSNGASGPGDEPTGEDTTSVGDLADSDGTSAGDGDLNSGSQDSDAGEGDGDGSDSGDGDGSGGDGSDGGGSDGDGSDGDGSDGNGTPQPPWPERPVGIFYLAWHTQASTAMREIPEGERLVAEDVIRDPTLFFSSMLLDRGLFQTAGGFHWHAEPEAGFYCLYRAREGDESPPVPDCPGIGEVTRGHAELLVEAGVDFVFTDLTNLPEDNEFSDLIGLRPIEVLFEEWQALREEGVATPRIAVWVPATEAQGAEAPLFRRVLELYARPEYAELVMRHEGDGLPVLFVVDNDWLPASEAFLGEIEEAGVLPVRLWGNLSQGALDGGAAAWMQPCMRDGEFTTLLHPEEPCAQGWSAETPIGSVVPVSASYQVGYASLPWQASGRYGGLTLQKQFETAFAVQPDYVLINAWNEHIAQPQDNPLDAALGNARRSMGIVDPPAGDGSAEWLWVDCYGHDLTRDIEPTVQGGSAAYDLMASCIRTYRLGPDPCSTPEGADEQCCQLVPGMHVVRALQLEEGRTWWASAHLTTTSAEERDALVGSGAWRDVCNVGFGPPGYCGDATTPNGPFLVFASDAEGRVPLWRCLKANSTHLVSTDQGCLGGTAEGVLGYIGTEQTSETPRPLRRCHHQLVDRHFHVLNDTCPSEPAVVDEGVLGFVR